LGYDLLLTGGHVLDPSQGLDGPADLAFADGRVAAIGPDLDRRDAAEVKSAAGCYVVPGLIDLHTHVYWGGTAISVPAERVARASGATTLVDTGSAGAGNMLGFRHHVIERSDVRILAFVNLSFPGIFLGRGDVRMPEADNLDHLSIPHCVESVRAHREHVVGIKIRVGLSTTGALGAIPLHLAIRAAEIAGVPVMVHVGAAPPPRIEDIAEPLRPGDILTHCYTPKVNSPLAPDGRVRSALRDARDRGVLFDVGHGAGSFGFDTAKAMLDEGFPPDVISSDVHVGCIDGPAHDVLVTMSKFLCLGLSLQDVVKAASLAPAQAIGHPELGSLSVGSAGDATLLQVEEGSFRYVDSIGHALHGEKRLQHRGIVLRGRLWDDGPA
jgi:dihydroorotase